MKQRPIFYILLLTFMAIVALSLVTGNLFGLILCIPALLVLPKIPSYFHQWRSRREQKKIDAEFDRVIGWDA